MKIRVGKLFELKDKYRKGFCAITPDLNDESSIEKYLDKLSLVLNDNKIYLDLIIFRNQSLSLNEQHDLYLYFEESFWDIFQRSGGELIPQHDGSWFSGLGLFSDTKIVWNAGFADDLYYLLPPSNICGGYHFKSNEIFQVKKSLMNKIRKENKDPRNGNPDYRYVFGCSCHNEADLKRANELELDYCLLSPIKSKNKDFPNMSWDAFSKLVSKSKVPVYALGGLELNDLETSKKYGAMGIAGISMFNQSS